MLLAFRASRPPEFLFTELAEDLVGVAFSLEASRASLLSPVGIRLSYLTPSSSWFLTFLSQFDGARLHGTGTPIKGYILHVSLRLSLPG